MFKVADLVSLSSRQNCKKHVLKHNRPVQVWNKHESYIIPFFVCGIRDRLSVFGQCERLMSLHDHGHVSPLWGLLKNFNILGSTQHFGTLSFWYNPIKTLMVEILVRVFILKQRLIRWGSCSITILVLLDFSLTVKAATLIFIYGCGSAISSAKEGKSGLLIIWQRVSKLFEPRKRACISWKSLPYTHWTHIY